MNLPVVIAALPAGAVVGSFAVTAGLRWARGEQALTGRSHCDACATPLGFARTVPIISYVRLGGRCIDCRASIHPGHLLGEVCGAALAMVSVMTLPIGQALLAAGLGLVLVGAAAADAASRRLPDVASLAVAVLGVALTLQRGPMALLIGFVAAATTGALLLGLRWIFAARTGDPKLGLGDVKLAMALALWVGAATPWVFVIAAPLGLIQTRLARSPDRSIAFGPALALGGWLVGVALQAGLFGDLFP
jgi:leader peptidase (prepilin peptidase)/N-methyltransferase